MNISNIAILLWALPVALCFHVTEEFAFPGGFIQWMELNKPRRLKSKFYYFAINATAIVVSIIIALTAKGAIGYCVYLWFTSFMSVNAASHLRASIQSHKYCPGSVTGGLLFIPMLVVSTWVFLVNNLVNWPSAFLNIVSGFVVSYFFSVDVRRRDCI